MAQPSRGKGRRYISYPTESANRRRDFRHSTDGPEVPTHRAARKDTKRWCRGVLGREHTYEWRRRGQHTWSDGSYDVQEVCRACGKHRGWGIVRPQ